MRNGDGSEMGAGSEIWRVGVKCCPNIVLGARRPNGIAPLVGLILAFGLALVYARHPSPKWDRSCNQLLWSGLNVHEALHSSIRATSCLSLALGWAGARFQLFFVCEESLLASMGATFFCLLRFVGASFSCSCFSYQGSDCF